MFVEDNKKGCSRSAKTLELVGNKRCENYSPISFLIKFSKTFLSGNWNKYLETNNWLSMPEVAYFANASPLLPQRISPIGGLSPSDISLSLK